MLKSRTFHAISQKITEKKKLDIFLLFLVHKTHRYLPRDKFYTINIHIIGLENWINISTFQKDDFISLFSSIIICIFREILEINTKFKKNSVKQTNVGSIKRLYKLILSLAFNANKKTLKILNMHI